MKSKNILKSFRIRIICSTILSLVFTCVTEGAIFYIIFCFRKVLRAYLLDGGIQDKFTQDWINPEVWERTYYNAGYVDEVDFGTYIDMLIRCNRELVKYVVIIVIIAVIIGVVLFVTYFLLLTRKFSNYLYEITEGIQTIASGNFEARIRVLNEDEFGVIAKSVNKLAGEVSEMIESERKMDQTKHDLITNVAHDLRTPLTSIIGYLDLANKSNITKEEREKYLAVAYEKSLRLERLIEDLFSFTKFSSGDVKVNKSKVDIVKFMEQIIDEFYPSFQEEKLEYEYKSNVECCMIYADGNLLARVFSNLLSNAVKYGKLGKKIKIQIEEREGEVEVTIVNYGDIIPEQDLPNIFDKFYRVENSRSIDTGGTGLGLAIAKKIVLLHEGRITATSDYDGTKFKVVLRKSYDD